MKIILSVDPGEKNIGIAKSDPLGIGATALCVFRHANLEQDAAAIAAQAVSVGAEIILVGQALATDGSIGPAARHAEKVAGAIRSHFSGEVILWDESGSTNRAKQIAVETGISKKRRRGHLDANAAAVILQDYLDFEALKRDLQS